MLQVTPIKMSSSTISSPQLRWKERKKRRECCNFPALGEEILYSEFWPAVLRPQDSIPFFHRAQKKKKKEEEITRKTTKLSYQDSPVSNGALLRPGNGSFKSFGDLSLRSFNMTFIPSDARWEDRNMFSLGSKCAYKCSRLHRTIM